MFCPTKQKCKGRGKKQFPKLKCDLHQSYNKYQQTLLKRQKSKHAVIQRKLYFDDSNKLVVDVCYQKGISMSLHDQTDLRSLIQAIERNEQRGFYLTDGNARLVGTEMVYSAVFTTRKYGDCDYLVVYNVDAPQLYERERSLSKKGYHITTVIPTTGQLTPLFIAVFWK